jgi:hypothetical protein
MHCLADRPGLLVIDSLASFHWWDKVYVVPRHCLLCQYLTRSCSIWNLALGKVLPWCIVSPKSLGTFGTSYTSQSLHQSPVGRVPVTPTLCTAIYDSMVYVVDAVLFGHSTGQTTEYCVPRWQESVKYRIRLHRPNRGWVLGPNCWTVFDSYHIPTGLVPCTLR